MQAAERGLTAGAEGTLGETEMSFILVEAVLTWLDTSIKTHRTGDLKRV